jgi:hypothetical protein
MIAMDYKPLDECEPMTSTNINKEEETLSHSKMPINRKK